MSIILKDASYSYDGKAVVSDISITLEDGSRTAIMGASGAGKTTLLHLMAGLIQPQAGAVTGIPKAGVAVVFQENRLLPWFTVLENLKIAVPTASTEKLMQLLESLNLEGIENKLPNTLSGGMARRVAIVRALAFESPLLLLDEPFGGLDEESKRVTAVAILDGAVGRTLVAVLHDSEDAQLLNAKIIRPFG